MLTLAVALSLGFSLLPSSEIPELARDSFKSAVCKFTGSTACGDNGDDGTSDDDGEDGGDETSEDSDDGGVLADVTGALGDAVDATGDFFEGAKVEGNGSDLVGEVDVETRTTIIEVTAQRRGKLKQMEKLQANEQINPDGRPVILYAPNYGRAAAKSVTDAGGHVVRSEAELETLLKKLGEG